MSDTGRRDALTDERDREFQRVWPMMLELGSMERHFNLIQGTYRTLASTWLLAALGGIGFIYSAQTFTTAVSRDLVAGCIAVAAALGVVLLWMLDLIVYHELLIAGYDEAKRFERQYAWLPRVRGHQRKEERDWPVRKKVSMFYLGTIALLWLVAAATLCNAGEVTKRMPAGAAFGGMALIGTVLIGFLHCFLTHRIDLEQRHSIADDPPIRRNW